MVHCVTIDYSMLVAGSKPNTDKTVAFWSTKFSLMIIKVADFGLALLARECDDCCHNAESSSNTPLQWFGAMLRRLRNCRIYYYYYYYFLYYFYYYY